MLKFSGDSKSRCVRLTVLFLLLCVFGNGNVLALSTRPSNPAVNVTAQPSSSQAAISDPLVAQSVYKKILNNDFEGAEQELSKYDGPVDSRVEGLRSILDEYDQIKASRKKSKEDDYEEKLQEYLKIEVDPVPHDVNDITEAFTVVAQLYQASDEEQKRELLAKEYIKTLVENAIVLGEQYNKEGKWLDAYSYCYYWMGILYKDNEEFKTLNEELTDKAVIEASFQDNSCERALDRYEGIRPEMLEKALDVLDVHYISIIDYGDMSRRGIKTCKYIGDVLAYSVEELPFRVSPEQAAEWKAGLIAMEESVDDSELKIVTRDKYVSVFKQILDLNKKTLEIPQEIIIAQFVESSFLALDPVTNLVWPWMVKDFQKSLTQNFTGIGIHIQKTRGVLKVASLVPDTPAYYSGLDADDEILAVNGEPTEDMPINCVVDKITGPAGTDVVLTIKSKDAPDGETHDITITRARIIVPTVRGWQRTDDGSWLHMIDPVNKLGYVRITNFTESTSSGLEEALTELEKQGMQGLILDLRYNSGGYLNTAGEVVDMFIDSGLIVKSQPRWSLPTYVIAKKKGTHPDYPIVVVVNGSSASASEIVAGALQDEKYKRATIVGARSYGKGSVQTITEQSGYGSQLKFTMAYYYLPSGQPVKTRYVLEKEGRTDWGIEPDINFELRNDEKNEMLDVQFSNDVLAKADHDASAEPLKRYTVDETLQADPQLAVGVLVLKTKVLKAGGQIQPVMNTETRLADKGDSQDANSVDNNETIQN